MPNSDYEKRLTGFIIHGFAIAHATTAALLSQTMVGDEAALTTLTVTMIISIARVNNKDWNIGDALSIIGVLAGTYFGTRFALLLVKWIPGIGNAANAITTFGVTELLGWSTYLLVREDKKPSELSKKEKATIKSQAKQLKAEEHDSSKHLYESMSPADKAEYESIMKQLRSKDLPEKTIMYLSNRLTTIAEKYI